MFANNLGYLLEDGTQNCKVAVAQRTYTLIVILDTVYSIRNYSLWPGLKFLFVFKVFDLWIEYKQFSSSITKLIAVSKFSGFLNLTLVYNCPDNPLYKFWVPNHRNF